jgi:hypothetical protein
MSVALAEIIVPREVMEIAAQSIGAFLGADSQDGSLAETPSDPFAQPRLPVVPASPFG